MRTQLAYASYSSNDKAATPCSMVYQVAGVQVVVNQVAGPRVVDEVAGVQVVDQVA